NRDLDAPVAKLRTGSVEYPGRIPRGRRERLHQQQVRDRLLVHGHAERRELVAEGRVEAALDLGIPLRLDRRVAELQGRELPELAAHHVRAVDDVASPERRWRPGLSPRAPQLDLSHAADPPAEPGRCGRPSEEEGLAGVTVPP